MGTICSRMTSIIDKLLLPPLLFHHRLLLQHLWIGSSHLCLIITLRFSLSSLNISLLKLCCHALIIDLLLRHWSVVTAHLHMSQLCNVVCISLFFIISAIVLILHSFA